jgi:molybdopterin molybdotransferase
MRAADWLSIEAALESMLSHVEAMPVETVALDDALGRTLAAPVISPVDQPPWDNSAMDGFAVHAADIDAASAGQPVRLRVVEEIHAGGFPSRVVGRGEATRIMTGAPVPAGADTIVRLEHTRTAGETVIDVLRADDARRNIRRRAEDIRQGETVMPAGRLLRSAEIGVLAMVGCTHPVVRRRPAVAILSTGDELVEPDRIADVVAGTHIINSNTPAIAAALRASGCLPVPLGIARDERTDLRARLEQALETDALITTAGASVGDHDLVKDVLEELGSETLFWRVKSRPGSPFSFGLLPREGRPPLPVFGLPGNPVSALVTYELLVRPVLRGMLGRTRLYPAVVAATAGEDMVMPPGLVRFLRVRLEPGTDDGVPRAFLTGPQGSGILTSMAAADGLLIVPLQVERIEAGQTARVVLLRGADDGQQTLTL